MSDRVEAGGEQETIACPHFVTQTKRQKVADCRADGWTSEGGQSAFGGERPGRFFGSVFFAKKRNSRRWVERCVCRNAVSAGIVQIVRLRTVGDAGPYEGWGTNVAVEGCAGRLFSGGGTPPLRRLGDKRSRGDGAMRWFSLSVKNNQVLVTSPKGRGNFIEEQHLTPRREVKTYA